MIDVPVEAVNRLSNELRARGMLLPPDVILDNLLENRTDIPINAIHMYICPQPGRPDSLQASVLQYQPAAETYPGHWRNPCSTACHRLYASVSRGSSLAYGFASIVMDNGGTQDVAKREKFLLCFSYFSLD